MKRVNVEVWSDFVCPWCWIAKRRLEKAAMGVADRIEVVVTPRSYRLAKGMAPAGFTDALYAKFGNPVAAGRMMDAVASAGAGEGLTYRFETMRFGDTTDAHLLVKSIRTPEDRQRMIERIFRGATTDGVDIFDRTALLDLAKGSGFPGASFSFEDREIASEIARDEMEANRIANGVPLFVFNKSFHLSGAREVGVFEKALLDAAGNVPDETDDTQAVICSIDGCTG
ncbi:DsbA family oxidoreductase (plasmid) [Burkholderia gladioli pv. gladioli]|uniref:DSBA-like thioredoxin domain protein n=1 Tax=Burkholderia gladioli TaxID=28095 RepID=A0AAW3F5X9_BURGA|nr:DsbA family oxidoreductase [Burkholderia gladioli]AJW93680.1 DSBA-like thioredoxin domain protein [Burkholderia gladioli]ASD84659.1 DsbA family oxidoreductase [Burkholderia gladioli pv. gladioli]AWY49824.1 DsbA family oxidoreductase [Burkholderia gladioli pv. gladioli]KGC16875.1 DSBA-like thioredoxin domain protein [Burkholderia gladioli]MDJ1167792.1 DsbA family oxidoreductase [Burkholderia gladioli pv. gladioli]